MVAHDQRVRQLEAELAAEGPRPLHETVGHLERVAPLQVLLEVLGSRLDVRVAEDVVQQAVHRLLPEERRVQLDGDVEAHLLHQEEDHRLDLAGRAAVEGREGHLAGERRPEVEVAEAPEVVRDLAPQGLDLGPRVLHRGDPGPHRGRADPGEVVAHAQVEDRVVARGVVRSPEQPLAPRHVDQHRALHVLAEALLEAQLLAPLHVVAHGLHVDARPRDGQAVVRLDRLELEEAAARRARTAGRSGPSARGARRPGPPGSPRGGRARRPTGRGRQPRARSAAPAGRRPSARAPPRAASAASRCGKGAGTSSATREPPRDDSAPARDGGRISK